MSRDVMVTCLVLCVENLELEEEDCDAIIGKQRKSSGMRD
jgi:hypothetical protein